MEVEGEHGATLSSPRGLETLLGGVGHDMGNALVPLVGLANQLGKEGISEKELRSKLDSLLEATLRLFTLSQKLACFALREGKERIAVDLKSLLMDADRVARSLFLHGERLQIDAPEDPVIVRANPCCLLDLLLVLLRGASAARTASAPNETMESRARGVARILVRLAVPREPVSMIREAALFIRSKDGATPLPPVRGAAEAARLQGASLEERERSYVVRLPLIRSPLGVPRETEARGAALPRRSDSEAGGA